MFQFHPRDPASSPKKYPKPSPPPLQALPGLVLVGELRDAFRPPTGGSDV